jgi:predicted transcriptional regulator of viral defense system
MSVTDGIVGPMTANDLREALRSVGIVTRAEALSAGVSQARIDTAVRNGTLIPVSRGVYLRAAVAPKIRSRTGGEDLLRAAAALAVAGGDAAVSHQSAALLLGIPLLGKPVNDVTLTVPAQRDRHGRRGIHLYATDLPAEQVATKYGFPVTTAARTVIDLARTLDFRAGVVAADSALFKKLTAKAELRSVVAALPRRPGIARTAEVIEFADGRAESPLESIGRVGFRDGGLPPPELQIQLGNGFEPIARVDFYWRQYRTAAEADGAMKYDNDPGLARRQLRRDHLLRAEGYEIVHFTWQDINFSPELVASWIRAAFRRQVETGAAQGRVAS